MVVRESCAQRLTHPIGIESCHYILVSIIICSTVEVVEYLAIGVERAIIAREFLKLKLLSRVHEVVVAQVCPAHIVATVVSETQLACLWLLCLYYYNAVGCLRTVDGCRRGILEDGDALYAVHAHVGYALEGRLETVEDEKRLVGIVAVLVGKAVDARRTVDVDVELGIRVRTGQVVLHDDKRRVKGGKALQHVLVAYLLEVLAAVGCSRTREALLLARIDTRDDGLADGVGVGLQANHVFLAGGHANLLRLHAHIGEGERGLAFGQHHAELAGLVGQGDGLAVTVLDTHAKQGQILVVDYYAAIDLSFWGRLRLLDSVGALGSRFHPVQ